MASRRYVPKRALGCARTAELAEGWGWSLLRDEPGDGERTPRDAVWSAPDNATFLHYVEDPITGLEFIFGEGEDVDRPFVSLCALSAPIGIDDVRRRMSEAETDEEIASAGFLAALISSPDSVDEEIVAILSACARAANPWLRFQSIGAMGYVPWAEFSPVLRAPIVAHRDKLGCKARRPLGRDGEAMC